MSADLLRRAAKTLRETAEAATPGPWAVVPPTDEVLFSRVESTSLPGWQGEVAEVHTPDERWPDHEYIALMHPPVALALADWLDGMAEDVERAPVPDDECPCPWVDNFHKAVNLARAILREGDDDAR